MTDPTPFSSQGFIASRKIIQPSDQLLGAPLPPLPPSFRILPPLLDVVGPPVDKHELETARSFRVPFLLPTRSMPFMNDVIRANRLLKGKKAYIEIGIFDRGNLAYVSNLLADDAVIIGVDIEAEPERDALIQKTIKPTQTCHIVIGDSRDPKTVSAVAEKLGSKRADAVFIDGGHDAFTVMHDYTNYSALLADDGVVMFHDSLWEGTDVFKGVADALSEIDKLDPIYLVAANWPCHRFMRALWREPLWGIVGVLPMAERYCARRVIAPGEGY